MLRTITQPAREPDMNRRTAIISLMAATASVALPSSAFRANQSVKVPRWSPKLGARIQWRTTFESRRNRGGMPEWRESTYTMDQPMTVLARTLDGYSVLWELQQPAGNSIDERGYAFMMSAYGLERIVIGTDEAGVPLRTYGAQAMRDQLEELASARRQIDPNNVRVIEEVIEKSESDPLFEAGAFVSASMVIGRLQRAQDWQAREGEEFTLPQQDYFQDEFRKGEARFKIEQIDLDTKRIKLGWTWDFPRETFPAWLQDHVNETLKRNQQMLQILPGPLREAATTAAARYTGTAFVSLEDGGLISAVERRELRIGNETMIAVISVARN